MKANLYLAHQINKYCAFSSIIKGAFLFLTPFTCYIRLIAAFNTVVPVAYGANRMVKLKTIDNPIADYKIYIRI